MMLDVFGWLGLRRLGLAPPASQKVLTAESDGTIGTVDPASIGVTDHGALTGLADDDHTQYHNDARGDARYYTQSQVNTALGGKENTGVAAGLVGTHEASLDPHPQYLTEAEGDAAYDALGSASAAQAAAEATAATALGTHEADTTNVHGIADTSALLDSGDIGTSVQGYDADLAAIAGLSPTDDDILQRKSSAWTNRTPAQVTADLSVMTGDAGSGGVKGLVPAPAAGDAAAGKFLQADATWAVPSGGGAPGLRAFPGSYVHSQNPTSYQRQVLTVGDRIYLCPFRITADEVIDEVYTYSRVAGTATTCKIAIYSPVGENPKEWSLTRDCGSVSVTTAGLKSITGLAQALPAGVHAIALWLNGTWDNLGALATDLQCPVLEGHATGFGTGRLAILYKDLAYGSFPASITTGVTASALSVPSTGFRTL